MSENTSLILADEKENLVSLGHSIKALLPGGQKLTENQAISIGNYASLTKANPFRGEVYGYQDNNGNLVLVDGYKLLVRWAKTISDYDEDYSDRLPVGVEGIREGDIGYRITIMRHDKKNGVREYIQMGATFKEAYGLVSNSAVGIVAAHETRNPPPKGWSWDEVARKRALKNVLNRAYPMPDICELARLGWEVNDTETAPEDWPGAGVYRTPAEAERHAELAAQERQRQEKLSDLNQSERAIYDNQIRAATDLMRNNGDDDPLDLDAESEEATPAPPAAPPDLLQLRADLAAAAEANPRRGMSTEKQAGLVADKLAEVFAGDDDAPEKALAVLRWLFDAIGAAELSFGEAHALLACLLAHQDPETRDYPLMPEFTKTVKAIYQQTQIEAGQLELF